MKTNQLGFTWIEVLMIIVILGIIGTIAIPRFVIFNNNPPETEQVKCVKGP